MAQQAQLPTYTTVNSVASDISIRTSFNLLNPLPNVVSGNVSDFVGVSNSISFIEGDLVVVAKNYPSQVSVLLNQSGELLLTTSTGDTGQYSIDGDGNLIYTF